METNDRVWQNFAQQNKLTPLQLQQFQTYFNLLVEWNEKINLTAITTLVDVLAYHFQDSIALTQAMDMNLISSCADVGTGAGFPILPLKIMFPHLECTLIEVNNKKINFLKQVIEELKLDNCTIVDLDWRTFLRHHHQNIDLFCARASLDVPELLRMFKPSSFYHASQLVYWASFLWDPLDKEKPLIQKEYIYRVGDKRRKLVFFEASKS